MSDLVERDDIVKYIAEFTYIELCPSEMRYVEIKTSEGSTLN